ncbi:hypothetical protein [Clostridium sp. AM58-1XD]|uniref:hypothetical protein n=1 Tax=Clostridium sp. AM58-1XD TaxID=2292307 RepID=UPI000E4F2D3B|nr:hypothetical protein [Clostridium sp. AM58-1XD]RGZ00872.1 hypothetical protein DXA13_02955 [Clostridium sp. AM58-1XD]
MPYCPKCDMEFIDGITVCTDCGGPLVESKEVADAMKKEEMEKQKAERLAAMAEAGFTPDMLSPGENAKRAAARTQSHVYVNKSQKYQDMKSSASAFYGVGAVLVVLSVLLWANVIHVPIEGTARLLTFGVLTIMGVGSLIVAVSTSKAAKQMSSLVQEEEAKTNTIVEDFIKNHSADSLDDQLQGELDGLIPEEISLKRLELIQDILITTHDIADQTYADSLAEELYGKLFDE